MNDGMANRYMPDFQVVEHTADWSLRVRGSNLAHLLVSAAYGMASLLVADIETLGFDEWRLIEVEAFDRESMLVEWLSELAFFAERDGVVYREFEVHVASPELARVTVRGTRPPQLHKHIKAVTYHNLEVIETAQGLEAVIVFDV